MDLVSFDFLTLLLFAGSGKIINFLETVFNITIKIKNGLKFTMKTDN
jgi:hypothetical protein